MLSTFTSFPETGAASTAKMSTDNIVDEEKILAATVHEIVENRKIFYERGESVHVLSKQSFEKQWRFVDNFWCHHSVGSLTDGSRQCIYRCALNQSRNQKIQGTKPAAYVNPSGRNFTLQKDTECTARLTVNFNGDEISFKVRYTVPLQPHFR